LFLLFSCREAKITMRIPLFVNSLRIIMTTRPPILLSFFFFMLAACATDEKKNSETEIQKNKAYVKFSDAKEFRQDWSKENTLVLLWKSDPAYLHPTNINGANARIVLG
jgi:hypothetical protein